MLAGGFIISACSNKPKESATKQAESLPENIVELNAEQFRVAAIQYGAVEMRSLSNNLKANGLVTVSPQNLASVCAPLGGFVKSTDLVQGSPVKKGQVLAIIENPEFIELQQKYLEARSKLDYAEGEFKRHQELYNQDVYSAKNFQEVTANYKSLKTEVNALKQKLSLIGIDVAHLQDETISPVASVVAQISGYIKTVNVNIGKFVSPTDVMFEIVNTSGLTIELTLFEKDITKVETGRKLRFSLSSDESKEYEAVITQVGKSISEDKTVKVYASLSTSSPAILPGMYVNASIGTTNNPVASLPSEAVVQFDEKFYIFIFDRDKTENGKPVTEFKMVEVRKGVTEGDWSEVILPDGFDIKTAKVVVKGAYNLIAAKKNAGEMAC